MKERKTESTFNFASTGSLPRYRQWLRLGWAELKPGARKSICVSHIGWQEPSTSSSAAFCINRELYPKWDNTEVYTEYQYYREQLNPLHSDSQPHWP